MKTWNTVDGEIDEKDLRRVVREILLGFTTCAEISERLVWGRTPRKTDRALQLLKAAGRIKYDHHGRRWSVVEGGGK